MNVLIVDDDRFVVKLLKEKVDWGNLGIEHVYTAHNIRQAKNVFIKQNNPVLQCFAASFSFPDVTSKSIFTKGWIGQFTRCASTF